MFIYLYLTLLIKKDIVGGWCRFLCDFCSKIELKCFCLLNWYRFTPTYSLVLKRKWKRIWRTKLNIQELRFKLLIHRVSIKKH